jgi:glutamate 5-kinase
MTPLTSAKRIVVKIGSALLVGQGGTINRNWLTTVCEDIAALKHNHQEIIIVTSGAVAIGRRQLGLNYRGLRLEEKQAAAATGQIKLAHAYQEMLAAHHFTVAQLLLTLDDSENRQRYLNARNTLETLLKLNAIPLINENDSVATQELRFGDNDRLAARVAQMVGADCLILLSDIDGLYSADPRHHSEARFIPDVTEITPDIEAMAGQSGSHHGSGGMVTKIQAAKIALAAGCSMVIAPGKTPHPIHAIQNLGRCTWFTTNQEPITARKQWIAGSLQVQGKVSVDEGAVHALIKGGSLLAVGITDIHGDFQKGDAIIIMNQSGQAIAKGLVDYSAEEVRLIMKRKSSDFEALLGYHGSDEIIHRDNLVVE